MNKHRLVFSLLAAALTTVALAPAAFAQNMKIVPAPNTDAASGAKMYKAYCASCHGVDGTGNGPAAPALKQALPDLTQLTRKHNGEFPALGLSIIIQGDSTITAHGNKDMPVWGDVFRSLGSTESIIKLRVHNLVTYISTMQK